jgi:hypothetical protein
MITMPSETNWRGVQVSSGPAGQSDPNERTALPSRRATRADH